MKKFLPLLGAILLVSLLVGLNGCILHTRTLTITVTDYVCTGFEEEHYDENYTDGIASFDNSLFEDLDAILADNDMVKADVESVSVVGVYYKVRADPDPTDPPLPATEWDVSGDVWIEVDGGARVLIASYQHVLLDGPTDHIRITTVQDGLDVLDAAIALYLSTYDPFLYPDIVFYSDREVGDIDPSPTVDSPLIMTWDGCLSMRVDFTEEFEVYDLFPGE